MLDGYTLPISYTFKYLGWWLCADGDQMVGLERRMEAAAGRFGELGRIWWSAGISVELKLRIYTAGVLSVLLYGCECWWLDEGVCSKAGAWNARRLAVITGRSIQEEYKQPARDVIEMARRRRRKWHDKVLRKESSSVVRQLLEMEADYAI